MNEAPDSIYGEAQLTRLLREVPHDGTYPRLTGGTRGLRTLVDGSVWLPDLH